MAILIQIILVAIVYFIHKYDSAKEIQQRRAIERARYEALEVANKLRD